jgi:hypothetical protein
MKDFPFEARLALVLALGTACAKPSPPDQEPPAPAANVAGSSPAPPAASRPNLAASAIVAIRARAASLAAPPERPRHLAFGRGFLLQATGSQVVTRSSVGGEVLARLPSQAHAVLGLPAGSVLVTGSEATYRFDPREERGHPLPRLSLWPDSLLLPSLTTQKKVWVVNPSTRNGQRYALDSTALVAIEAERAFTDYDGGPIAVLSDGDFLYSAGRELVRDPSFGRPKRFPLPGEIQGLWRLAAAERLDRAWLVTATGTLFLFELGERPRIVRRIETGELPIDFAASKTTLAIVSVTEREGEPRKFKVSLYSHDGRQRFSHALTSVDVTADLDWAARALRDRELVVTDNPSRIAVGGQSAVVLFDAATGQIISSE